ncbi:ComEC/Rec2 family competence protein [Saccharibacillus kuerlensis]|uniref:Metallo-beta-lactamase domain-containing protein n=1 Tax=Saccharibacillus kuerlensis TaxID=459527 RepID=A0ABQ2KYB5_9BACL|nr:ComEC/Rec2 family competence protein [Saccharibacillus kuerlensis]GGN96928.1 hypothetical protein GCM10010969_14340 [Saccharibacillus kuerlensis]
MNRRPLVVFTVCWLAGTAAAHLYGGLQLTAVLAGLTFIWFAAAAFAQLPLKRLLIFGLALWLAAGYGTFRDIRSLSILPEVLGVQEEGGYPGVRLEGKMAGPAKIDGDLAMFEMDLERVFDRMGTQSSQKTEADEENLRSAAVGADGTSRTDIPGNHDNNESITLRRSEKIIVRVKLAAEEEQDVATSWKRGDRLIVSADLELPAEARNFGAFDYRSYLREKRIYWIAKAGGASSVETADHAEDKFLLLRHRDDLREFLADKLSELYPGVGAGYMQGLLLGLRDGLDPDTYQNFVRLGMTHVLAISGMHVGLYVGAVLLLLRRTGVTKESSLIAALCAIPPYVLLTGASPSAVRAGLMSMIGLYAARRGWLKDGLHILCLAALLMLLWEPSYLTAISFQLSFVVTAGIILLVRPMQRILFFLPKTIAAAAAISLVADLVSFPLGIYYFNQYPLLGLAANLLLVPLISLVSIPCGAVSLLLSTFWMQGAEWTAYPVRLINAAVFWCADGGGSIRWARTIWASPSPGWIMLYEAALFSGIFLLAALLRARRPDPSAFAEADVQGQVASPGSAAALGLGGDTVPLGSHTRVPRMRAHAGGPRAGARPGRFAAFAAAASHAAASLGGAPSGAAPPRTHAVRYGGLPDSRRNRLRPLYAAAAFIVLGGLLTAAYQPRPSSAGLVQMLDVGQGDSILITTPEGRNLLVDGGGTVRFERPGEEWRRRLDPYEVGRDVVVPLLKKRGVQRLDAVILTHGDRDHYGGLLAVLDEIPTDRLIMNGTRSGGEDLDRLLASALKFGAEVYAPRDGDLWNPDERTILEFLNPSGTFAGLLPQLKEQNEYSVVFRMEMNGHSFLFTGDIGESAEQDILSRLDERGERGRVEVLKVGHHGSKGSSSESWIRRWSPALSLISVGANNTYGHPSDTVIERLNDIGSVIHRTDLDGEIQVEVPLGQALQTRTKLGKGKNDIAAE